MSVSDISTILSESFVGLSLFGGLIAWLLSTFAKIRDSQENTAKDLKKDIAEQMSSHRREIDKDIGRHGDALRDLQARAAYRDDVSAVEARITAALSEFKAESKAQNVKIDAKLDAIPRLVANMETLMKAVDSIVSRA